MTPVPVPSGVAGAVAGAGPDRAGDVAAYALRLGDDALVLAQRLSVWVASAPDLEEDLAIANIALDLLGQARSLLSYAGELEGAGRDEDALALERDERDFTNVLLVEQPNGDFGTTMARQLLFSAYQLELYRDLTRSTDETLAGVAAKAEKEVAYHRDHAARWVVRLGDGTEESHVRMQAGVDQVWPYAEELWDVDDLQGRLQGCGVAPGLDGLRPACEAFVAATLAEATLSRPETTWRPSGGRGGRHTEPFGYMLAEMQHLHRSHQGARW